MNKRWLLIMGIALTLSTCIEKTCAQHEGPDALFDYAENLMQEGDYYRAITEFKRFLFHYPNHAQAAHAEYRVAEAYVQGEQWPAATERLVEITRLYPGEEVGQKANLLLAETYYRQQKYDRAIQVLEEGLRANPPASWADKATLKLVACHVQQGRMEEALTLLDHSAVHEEQLKNLPLKSPGWAAGLSAVLPGAGQLYVGRPRDAAIAFLLNGVFIWATIESFDEDLEAVGSLFGFIELSWYVGNVYNAANSAHKANRNLVDNFMNNLTFTAGIMREEPEAEAIPQLGARLAF